MAKCGERPMANLRRDAPGGGAAQNPFRTRLDAAGGLEFTIGSQICAAALRVGSGVGVALGKAADLVPRLDDGLR